MSWNRRRVLQGGAGLAGLTLAAGRWGRACAAEPKRIQFESLHTSERLSVSYWRDGAYDPEALAQVERLLRDFRTDQRHPIDPKLLDYLVDVAGRVGREPSFSVISGYRSPATNQMLHERSSGVAQRSLHMEGRAIDVRMHGVDCAALAAQAIDLKRGGVGYYRGSDFVHLDTGAFRTWRG